MFSCVCLCKYLYIHVYYIISLVSCSLSLSLSLSQYIYLTQIFDFSINFSIWVLAISWREESNWRELTVNSELSGNWVLLVIAKFEGWFCFWKILIGNLDGKPDWESSRSVVFFVQRTRGSSCRSRRRREPEQRELYRGGGAGEFSLGYEAQPGYFIGLDLRGAGHSWWWAS